MKNIIKIIVFIFTISIFGSCYPIKECLESPLKEHRHYKDYEWYR